MNADEATFLRDFLCETMAREAAATKKVLAALPEDKKDYRPDARSRTAWELAQHLAGADVWFLTSIADGKFVWAGDTKLPVENVAELVSWYDAQLKAALARVNAMTPEQLTAPLDFFGMWTQPCAAFLGLASHHSVHHRAQLGTYLRPMGAKVPAMYGESADERIGG
jgi:uncharacterized damage-inducible protein DinB